MFSPFTPHTLQFQPVDPLGDGLRDDIEREQNEPGAEDFQKDIDGNKLEDFWSEVEKDVKKDPDWFTFSED